MPPPAAARDTDVLDKILAFQLLVAWAGEGRSEPKQFGLWDSDLVDQAGGGDLLARLAPRTRVWSSLELIQEAARRVDAKARGKHGDPDKLRSLFFLGFELDEKVSDRLAELKRAGKAPEDVLPLPLRLNADFTPEPGDRGPGKTRQGCLRQGSARGPSTKGRSALIHPK